MEDSTKSRKNDKNIINIIIGQVVCAIGRYESTCMQVYIVPRCDFIIRVSFQKYVYIHFEYFRSRFSFINLISILSFFPFHSLLLLLSINYNRSDCCQRSFFTFFSSINFILMVDSVATTQCVCVCLRERALHVVIVLNIGRPTHRIGARSNAKIRIRKWLRFSIAHKAYKQWDNLYRNWWIHWIPRKIPWSKMKLEPKLCNDLFVCFIQFRFIVLIIAPSCRHSLQVVADAKNAINCWILCFS